MDTKVNVLTDSEHEVEVNLSYEEIQPEINEAYDQEKKSIEIPGFRKGKAPMSMIKKMYGDAIEYKAAEKIANKKFWDVVESEKLNPVSTPALTDIDFQPGEGLNFKVKYEVIPNIEVKDYTGLEIEKPLFTVKQDDIDAEVTNALKSQAQLTEADEITDNNFKIIADLQRVDETGVPMVGSRSENMAIDLSDEKVNPQIGESAQGKKVGDTFSFSFDDEHKHGEEIHKETFHYEGEIKKIEKITIPEPNEELIKKLTRDQAKDIDELRDLIRDNFNNYYTNQSESIYSNSLLSKIVENNDFEAPKGFVENVLNRMVEIEKDNAKRSNQPVPNDDILKKSLNERAVWTSKWQIIMNKIAEKENIKVEDSDIEEIANQEAAKTGISPDKLIQFYKESNRTDAILEEKVIKFLKENNQTLEIDADEKIKKSKEGKSDDTGNK